jgi:hypothetical protein
MAQNAQQTVTLARGSDYVTMTVVRGETSVTCYSTGDDREFVIDLDEARERIARLMANGWRVS